MAQRTKVLLTGFDPFDGEALNPSWEAVRALDGWKCGRATVHARQMPCAFGQAIEALASAMEELRPELVLSADLAREDVIRAVQATPASEYLVVDGPPGQQPAAAHIVGVLTADDLANLLDPKRTIR